MEVHGILGPGLLESVYEECLVREFSLQGLSFERQPPVPIQYKGTQLESCYRADFVVEGRVLVELKAVPAILPIHLAQVLTYLKLMGLEVGLLVNFNTAPLRQGIRRLTRRTETKSLSPCLPVQSSGEAEAERNG
jgi:GxxExxY protein